MKNNDHKIPLFSIAFVSCPFQPISFRSGKIGLVFLLGWLHCCKRRVVAFMLVFYIITRTTFTKMENLKYPGLPWLQYFSDVYILMKFQQNLILWCISGRVLWLLLVIIQLEFLKFKELFQQNLIWEKKSTCFSFSLCIKMKVSWKLLGNGIVFHIILKFNFLSSS